MSGAVHTYLGRCPHFASKKSEVQGDFLHSHDAGQWVSSEGYKPGLCDLTGSSVWGNIS